MIKNKKIKGIIISTEIILILAAVIVLTTITMIGLGRMVMNQATSNKATAVIDEANVWIYKLDGTCKYISITFYITNLGSKPITVGDVFVQIAPEEYNINEMYVGYVGKTVNPGEMVGFSVSSVLSSCPSFPSNGDKTFVFVNYYMSNKYGRIMTIGKPVTVTYES